MSDILFNLIIEQRLLKLYVLLLGLYNFSNIKSAMLTLRKCVLLYFIIANFCCYFVIMNRLTSGVYISADDIV